LEYKMSSAKIQFLTHPRSLSLSQERDDFDFPFSLQEKGLGDELNNWSFYFSIKGFPLIMRFFVRKFFEDFLRKTVFFILQNP